MKRLLFALLLAVSAQAAITTVADTLYLANGTRFSGPINISWPSTFTSASGRVMPAGKLSTLVVNGALSVGLEANDLATPAGTYYIAQYRLNNGILTTEFWVVPTSGSPVTLATVRTVPAPSTSFMIALSQLLQTGATVGQCLVWGGSVYGPATCGTGTLTTISFTGGLISIANPTTAPALTVAGTSGGIPYFSSSSTWASSGALGANLPLFGGGAGSAPIAGTRSGNTTKVGTVTGSTTSGVCLEWDASGNIVNAVSVLPCGTGLFTVKNNGSAVGSPRAILNFTAPTGLSYTMSDTGTQININLATEVTDSVLKAGPLTATTTSSSATTYTATCSPTCTAPSSSTGIFTTGAQLNWKVSTSCTGGVATTLNVDTTGAKSVKQSDGSTDPAAAQCVSGLLVPVWYDGTRWRIVNPLGSSSTAPWSDWQKQTSAITMDGTDKTVFTVTMPAASLAAGKCLELNFWSTHAGSNGVAYLLWTGATSYSVQTATADTTLLRNHAFWCNDSGATNSQQLSAWPLNYSVGQFTIWTTGGAGAISTSAIDTTASVVIKFTGNGAGTETVTGNMWQLRVIP